MSQLNEYVHANTYHREFVLDRECEAHVGHYHNYPHTTVVNRGAVLVYCRPSDSEPWAFAGRHERGDLFEIPAKLQHRIKAAENGTVYTCLFAHRDFGEVRQVYRADLEAEIEVPDPAAEIVPEWNGNPAAYV